MINIGGYFRQKRSGSLQVRNNLVIYLCNCIAHIRSSITHYFTQQNRYSIICTCSFRVIVVTENINQIQVFECTTYKCFSIFCLSLFFSSIRYIQYIICYCIIYIDIFVSIIPQRVRVSGSQNLSVLECIKITLMVVASGKIKVSKFYQLSFIILIHDFSVRSTIKVISQISKYCIR